MDYERVEKLIDLGSTSDSIQRILDLAAKVMERNGYGYTLHNACAATLSTFLREAEIPVPITLGAGRLAKRLAADRQWQRVPVGFQRSGDIGVTYDRTGGGNGADHIYLVIEAVDRDKMRIADNQAPRMHDRYASGRGKTPTEYFLRASTGVSGFDPGTANSINPNDQDFFPWDDEPTGQLEEPYGGENAAACDQNPLGDGDNVDRIARRLVEILADRLSR